MTTVGGAGIASILLTPRSPIRCPAQPHPADVRDFGDDDSNGRPHAALAISWQASGGQRWRFRLRHGVKFHDGTALTAENAASSLRAANPAWNVFADADSVVIEPDGTDPTLLAQLAQPRNAIAKRNSDNKPAGTGPFHIVDWQPGKKLILAAEEDYWNGRPFLDSVEIEMGKSYRDQMMALQLGKADLVEVAPEQAHRFSLEGDRLVSSAPLELLAVTFSRDVASPEDKLLREALALSLDRGSVRSVLFQGAGQPTAAVLPDWMSGYGFVFPADADLPRARQAREQVHTIPRWIIGYDSGDPVGRLLAERIALNGKDAGLWLQAAPSATADLQLMRTPLPADPWIALADVTARAGLPAAKSKGGSVEDLYAAEQEALATLRIIPLFHLPVYYACGRHAEGLDAAARWKLGTGRRVAGEREAMIFRRKLLAVFALTVCVSVAAVTGLVLGVTRRAFEKTEDQRISALVAQFQREFVPARRRSGAAHSGDRGIGTGYANGHRARPPPAASAGYFELARTMADNYQLDFLEFVDGHGIIISSAQSPAKFGYPESGFENLPAPNEPHAFLMQQELQDSTALALLAVRATRVGEHPDLRDRRAEAGQKFSFRARSAPRHACPALPESRGSVFADLLIDPSAGSSSDVNRPADKFAPLVEAVRQYNQETTWKIQWSSDQADDELFHAIPLRGVGKDRPLLGVLLIGNSQRSYVELKRHIGLLALLVGGGGILLAILLSSWAAARVTRPVEQLVRAAQDVAAGNWNARVEVPGGDELSATGRIVQSHDGELAEPERAPGAGRTSRGLARIGAAAGA